ncbi:MAG: hypothetical protein IK073_06840 [Paludibacteraceae bacterium]|nr:hypothetical protein [Paludibacteraceae bacterium]
MTKPKTRPARQAGCAERRNKYRRLAIEYYARNSQSVVAITRQHWPDRACTSQPELARLLTAELGWEVNYRSLSRQLRRVHRLSHVVRERIDQLIYDLSLYEPDFTWDDFCINQLN